ncbi:hypothetical protein PINS_up004410 [Pythium insidiosum]|nr:hypothetical protein PINS_up004410 [Pythium insidiosum]
MLTVVWLLARHVRELNPPAVLDLMKRSYDAASVEAMSVCLEQWVVERADHSDLTVVPVEVFNRGSAAIASYLKELSASTVALYRHKLCVVGPQEWGKTSLVRSLSSGRVALERAQDRTIGIDVVPWQFERQNAGGIGERHEVTWWDFAGQDVYLAAHTVFYSRRAVFLVVVDLSAYERVLRSGESQREKIHEATMRGFVETALLQRLRIIVARQPDASFIFVGTKADAVASEQSLEEIKNDLTLRLNLWQDDWVEADDRLLDSDGGPQRIGVVSRLADAPWLFVSCADQTSLDAFSQDLQTLILSRRMGFRVPDKYAIVLERLDDRRRVASASLPDQIAALCSKELSLRLWLKSEIACGLDDDECRQVLRIFHDLGELLWFEDEAGGSLSRYVFLSPKLVINFVRDAINHAYVESDDVSAMAGLPEAVRLNESLAAWLTSIRQAGRIPHALLMNMAYWQSADQDLVLAVKQLLNSVGLAYPAESQVMKWDSDLIAPAYWQMTADSSMEHRQFERLSTLLELSPTTSAVLSEQYIEYEFVSGRLPSTLFEQLIVHSFTPGVNRVTTNQFVAQTVRDESVLRIAWFGGGRGPSGGHRVRVESMAVTDALSTRVLHFGCMVIERALESYPGLQPLRDDVRMEQDDAVAFATIEASEWFQKKHWRIPGVLNAFPRLLRTERVTPISLSLDVTSGGLPTTVVDWRGCFVDWSLCHPNHAEALGFRRCQLPLDDAMQPDWSSLSVRFSNVPAMQVLRDCRLEVSFLCRGWLCCLAPRVIASGYGGFCDVLQDESTALVRDVEMSMSLKHGSVDGSDAGYMRLRLSCQAMESKSMTTTSDLPSPGA